jgi:hypothetical protein
MHSRISTAGTLILAVLLFMPLCSRLTYDIEPDATASYYSLRIKVNARNRVSGKRQSFKVMLKYNDTGDKMMFLSPLNQVYGLLFIRQEDTVLINSKKKKYWKGKFKRLLREMWGEGLDFNYSRFKKMLVEGIIPQEQIEKRGIRVIIDKKDRTGQPARLTIENRDILVNVKISSRKTGRGRLGLAANIKGMRRSSIDELLGNE